MVDGQRVREVYDVSVDLLRAEVTLESPDNKVDEIVVWTKKHWQTLIRGITNNLLKFMLPVNRALQEMPM